MELMNVDLNQTRNQSQQIINNFQ